jgi:hypothetical protein
VRLSELPAEPGVVVGRHPQLHVLCVLWVLGTVEVLDSAAALSHVLNPLPNHDVCHRLTRLSSGALTLFLDDACKAVGLRGVPDLLLASNTLGPGHRAGVGILVLRRPDTELFLIKDGVHRTPDVRVSRCGVR